MLFLVFFFKCDIIVFMKKSIIKFFVFFLIIMHFTFLVGCGSSRENIRRIRPAMQPVTQYRCQKTSYQKVGNATRQVSRSIGPVGRSVFSAVGYSVIQGIAVFGQSLGYSMATAGGVKPLLGAILYIPASGLKAIR